MHSDTTLHDPEAVFQKMMEVGRICSAGQKIDMIALSGTWHSVGLFQQDFTPVTPILSLVKHGGIKNQQKIS